MTEQSARPIAIGRWAWAAFGLAAVLLATAVGSRVLRSDETATQPEEVGGFWGIALGDGAGLDRDGQADSRLTVDLLDLQPLGDSDVAPERLQPKDVIIGVDPQSLQVYAKRLADGPDEGNGGGNGAGNGQGGE